MCREVDLEIAGNTTRELYKLVDTLVRQNVNQSRRDS